ncbi:MAG: ATP-binding protein [Candidatus Omnitrophota bacterium]
MEIYAQEIQEEKDILAARDRARVICEELGFGTTEQLQVSTSVFELGKNILEHGKGGRISFSLQTEGSGLSLEVEGVDQGPGLTNEQIKDLLSSTGSSTALRGVQAMKRLMDSIVLESEPGEGTHIRLIKKKKEPPKTLARNIVGFFQEKFSSRKNPTLSEELRIQNINLLQTLSLFEEKNKELERINKELLDVKKELEKSNSNLQERTAELQEALLSLGDRTTELEANERRFAAVLDKMSQGVAITDRSGVVIIANPRFLEIFSLQIEETLETTKVGWFALLGRFYDNPSENWNKIVANMDANPHEVHSFVLKTAAIPPGTAACRMSPIVDEDDKIVGRLWIFNAADATADA